MSAQKTDVRRARLERLAERAQRAREVARQAKGNPIAAARTRMTAIAASLAVMAFANAPDESAVQKAADAVESVLIPIADAVASALWDLASGSLPALEIRLKEWAKAAGVDYKSPTDAASPSQLVASLKDAIEKKDADAASVAIEAIRESFDPGDEPSAVVAAANRARRHGAPMVTSTRAVTDHLFAIDGQNVWLSKRELEICSEMGATPENYARNKLIQQRARDARQRPKNMR